LVVRSDVQSSVSERTVRRSSNRVARAAILMPFDDYKVLHRIGSGSYGMCYLVQQNSPGNSPSNREVGRKLVMKEIDLTGRDSQQREVAHHEVKVFRDLKHPYIVRYWESFIHEVHLCIIMDYCEGGDLWQYIQRCKEKRTTIPEVQVVRWFTQMSLALKYMHEVKDVLHRDIKTQNIFLHKREDRSFGDVKIADFGISKVLGQGAQAFARTLVGTPYYLSPEMCLKQPYAWPSDMWALGCVLYEMCALKVLFDQAQEIAQLVERICNGSPPKIPATYSEELCELGSKLLSRETFKRPTADAVLKKPMCQAEIKKMLAENQKENNKENKSAVGEEHYHKRVEKRVDNYREGSHPPEQERGRGQQRRPTLPMGEHNARELSRQRAASKTPSKTPRPDPRTPSSRAPSPHKAVAMEVLRSVR